MEKKKKVIVLSCMLALLAVTAVFNYVFTGTGNISATETAASNAAGYFAQYRAERLSGRNEELLQLDSIIAASNSNSEEYNKALQMKTGIVANTEREMLLESLIKASGFEDAVVVIGLDSSSVNVIAKSSDFTAEDAVAIYTIVYEEVGVSPENVKIIPIS